jgi:choline dehydrogenase-like flavoprotein
MSHYDVIVIGSGAGGGTLAHRLAPSGKQVLLLERGDWLPREPQNWSAADVFVDNRYVSPDTWYDAHGKTFQPQVHYFVGGATKLYGAALYRLRAEDFGELAHSDGLSPAWPVGYDEFEPYYTQAEQLYQVHGARGEDPTEPPASAPYPFAPVSHEPRMQQLSDDLAAVGLHPFHAPCGVLLDEQDPLASHCVRCGTCDGFPCLVHAKSDADVLAVRPALEHPNVTLLTRARAVMLETNTTGTTVTGVVVERDGERETFTADLVVVSAGAANSAALLLYSVSPAHPQGLANSSGQVGRNYMFHNSQAVLALSKEPNPTVFQKTLGINDFYFGSDDYEFPLGNIQMVGKSSADMYRGEKPLQTRLAPQWTLDQVARHAVDFWLSTEDLPRMENRVTLRRDGSIQLAYEPTNQVPKQRLLQELKHLLKHTHLHEHHLVPRHAYLKNEIPVAGVAHQAGTCRFGLDPVTSVLDANCRTHDVDNLYVVDTSFFPSIGAVNPALTAMANALRVGDHLLDRLGAARPQAEHAHAG